MNDLNQIQRIKIKLEQVRKIDTEFKEFGADFHKYQINKTATEKEIEEFENKYEIELPIGYKQFLLEVGNGGIEYKNYVNSNSGAGPFYGIYQLGVGINEITEFAFLTLKDDVYFDLNMTEKEWRANAYDKLDNATDKEYEKKIAEVLSGIMIIGHGGCSNYQGLILNGKDKGKVIYLYMEIEYKPHIPEDEYFLDWYEAWLNRIIENATISPIKEKKKFYLSSLFYRNRSKN